LPRRLRLPAGCWTSRPILARCSSIGASRMPITKATIRGKQANQRFCDPHTQFRPSHRSQHTSDQALDNVVACWRFEKTHPMSWSCSSTRSSALSITQTPHGWQLYVCRSGRLSVPEVIRERRSVLAQLGQTSRSIVWSTTRVDFGISMLHLEKRWRVVSEQRSLGAARKSQPALPKPPPTIGFYCHATGP
jgi:hypothetical protein